MPHTSGPGEWANMALSDPWEVYIELSDPRGRHKLVRDFVHDQRAHQVHVVLNVRVADLEKSTASSSR